MSAVSASSAASGSVTDPVRALQHALYRAAKADPGRRFHTLSDKVHRRDVLERAWADVRRNGGAAGIDRTTITDVQEYGVSRLLDELVADLKIGSSTIFTAACTTRSRVVGIPSRRNLPDDFGMVFSRTRCGTNLPAFNSFRRPVSSSVPAGSIDRGAIRSTPAVRAPLLPRTRPQATTKKAGS